MLTPALSFPRWGCRPPAILLLLEPSPPICLPFPLIGEEALKNLFKFFFQEALKATDL